MGILKQANVGVSVVELRRERGMSASSFYNWRSKYGEMVGLPCQI
jgi:putative transposase